MNQRADFRSRGNFLLCPLKLRKKSHFFSYFLLFLFFLTLKKVHYLCMYIHIHTSYYIIQKIILLSLFYILFLHFSYVFSYANTVTLRYVTEPLGHGFLIRSMDNTSIHFVELFWVLNGVVYTKPLEQWLAHRKFSNILMSTCLYTVWFYMFLFT